MGLTINVSDKVLAGVHQSYTLLSDEGPPSGSVRVSDAEVEHRVLHLGPTKTSTGENERTVKYKVTFYLPDDAAGKTLRLEFRAGESTVEKTEEILAE